MQPIVGSILKRAREEDKSIGDFGAGDFGPFGADGTGDFVRAGFMTHTHTK